MGDIAPKTGDEMMKFRTKDDVIIELRREDCERCETLKCMLESTVNVVEDESEGVIPLTTLLSKDMNMLKQWLTEDEILPSTMADLRCLMVVANFLEVKELIDSICRKIAQMVSGQVPSKIKDLFEMDEPTKNRSSLFARISAEMPPYNGTDSNLQVDRKTCYSHADDMILAEDLPIPEELLLCTGCRLMKYCSKRCQREDWSTHKENCREIQKAKKAMDREEKEMLRLEGGGVIQQYMGHVWGNIDCRDYCRARLRFADSYLTMAHEEEHASMYEAGLKHYLELQRLIRSDNMGLRDKTPFIMINLNRHDDAYNFIKFWSTVDEDFWCEPKPFLEGEWMYLKDQDRFEDPALFIGKKSYMSTSLAHLVALLILKLSIIAKHTADLQVFKSVWEHMENDKRWGALMDTRDCLKQHMVGNSKHFALMESQRNHIEFLFARITKANKVFLKAVLNPEPLRSQPYPSSYSHGSPEEAFLVLNDCCRTFHRLPGALKRIQAFVGSDTSYDCTFTDYGW